MAINLSNMKAFPWPPRTHLRRWRRPFYQGGYPYVLNLGLYNYWCLYVTHFWSRWEQPYCWIPAQVDWVEGALR